MVCDSDSSLRVAATSKILVEWPTGPCVGWTVRQSSVQHGDFFIATIAEPPSLGEVIADSLLLWYHWCWKDLWIAIDDKALFLAWMHDIEYYWWPFHSNSLLFSWISLLFFLKKAGKKSPNCVPLFAQAKKGAECWSPTQGCIIHGKAQPQINLVCLAHSQLP